MPPTTILQIEKAVAAGCGNVSRAAYWAENLTDQGFSDDLWEIHRALAKIGEDLLKGRRRAEAILNSSAYPSDELT